MTSRRFASTGSTLTLLTLTLTLTLTLSNVGGVEAFFAGYNYRLGGGKSYYPGREAVSVQKLQDRVAMLGQLVNDHFTRLQIVEHVVTDLARQECETGEANVHVCPGGDTVSLADDVVCVSSPVLGTLPIRLDQDFHIPFNKRFLTQPVVELSTSNQDHESPLTQNCTVEVKVINGEGLTFTLHGSKLCPVPVRVSWYACPSALFTAEQGLPLPPNQGMPSEAESEPEPENVPSTPNPTPKPGPPTRPPQPAKSARKSRNRDSDKDDK